jgi:hypothetical protein
MTDEERAELEILRDLRERLILFGGDDFTVASWESAHSKHANEPYIGCVFCRDKFALRADVIEEVIEYVKGLNDLYNWNNWVTDKIRKRFADG